VLFCDYFYVERQKVINITSACILALVTRHADRISSAQHYFVIWVLSGSNIFSH